MLLTLCALLLKLRPTYLLFTNCDCLCISSSSHWGYQEGAYCYSLVSEGWCNVHRTCQTEPSLGSWTRIRVLAFPCCFMGKELSDFRQNWGILPCWWETLIYHFYFCVRSFHWCSFLGFTQPLTALWRRVSFMNSNLGEWNEHDSTPCHRLLAVPLAQVSWLCPYGACRLGDLFNSGKY